MPNPPRLESPVIDGQYSEVKAQAEAKSIGGKLMDWIKDNHAQQPELSGQLAAMGREAIKDVRNTLHEAFFGQPEHMSEPGAPLNPTQQLVTEELGHSMGYNDMLADAASRTSGQDRERSMGR